LESYQTILSKFENSIRESHALKEKAIQEKEAVIQEIRAMRARYINIVGKA
jgi:hypothetical protein